MYHGVSCYFRSVERKAQRDLNFRIRSYFGYFHFRILGKTDDQISHFEIVHGVCVCWMLEPSSTFSSTFALHTSLTHSHACLTFHYFTEEKLAESTAANAALSSQLENISPQLTQLETALTESRHKLKKEQQVRRTAEQAQDEAEVRLREMEQSVAQVREECDVVHEELAFKENELEETRWELEVEKQQLENELAAVRLSLAAAEKAASVAVKSTDLAESRNTAALADEVTEQATGSQATADSVPSVDDGYVKKLEEELELVTEQLIETEKRLSETELQLESLQTDNVALQEQGRSEQDDDLIRQMQSEVADHMDVEQRLRDELEIVKEELTLTKEEVTLQQEELQALEADARTAQAAVEEQRTMRRNETNELHIQIKEAEMASRNTLGEAALVASTVTQAGKANLQMEEEIQALEAALELAKTDYQGVLEELDDVNGRFDEAREEAEQAGREAAAEEMRVAMKSDVAHEVKEMKEQLNKLSEENTDLQQKVDDAEIALAAVKDNQERHIEGAEVQSEVARQLQAQLARAKEDLAKKEKEMSVFLQRLEDRLAKAEENVTHLEGELHTTKGQLAESEAHLIVLRREKERSSNTLVVSPSKKTSNDDSVTSPSSVSRSVSTDREELSGMEASPSSRKLSTPARNRSRSTSPASVMKWEYRLAEESKKYDDLQKDYNVLQDQKRMGEVRIKRLEVDLRILQKELFSGGADTAVVTQMTRLSSLASKDTGAVDNITDEEVQGKRVNDIIESRDVKLISEELKSLEKKCNGHREYNAQLLSKMLHLQGNIQVYCRLRPMTITEVQNGYKSVCESLSETEVGCYDNRTNKWKSFSFDRVWGPDQSQQSVFQDVEPLALSVVDGFNACIFAYGQTGSGKTFTMEGTEENNQYGISYRTIQKIFHLLSLRSQQQRAAEMFVGNENEDDPAKEVAFNFTLKLGMLEIYNDEIYDLLNTAGSSMAEKKQGAMNAGGKTSLDIRQSKEGRIEVPDLTKETVHSIQEVMALLKRGNSHRATATTDMNEHSSRSHMVLMVDVISGLDDAQTNKGTLYLVDLAGSERVRKSNVQGDQLKEAGFINKSLSALGNVMEALDRKASHVPFRDSKLTYMLQDSLGGNSRTMMVVTINPIENSFDESVHALAFATRVRRIQIGSAQRNVTSKNLEETVKALTNEMRSLTRAKERTEGHLHSLKRDNARVQDKLQNMSKSKTQGRTDNKTLDMLRKNNDDMAARWKKEKTAREESAEELEKASKELRTVKQQLGKANSKLKTVEQRLEDNDRDLTLASKELRDQRANSSAATHRARRDQVLGARSSKPEPTGAAAGKAAVIPVTPMAATAATDTNGFDTPVAAAAAPSDEVVKIRSQVLELLEKHDEGKVNRIDIIMDKFKGKEALLLDKMTQRYEADAQSTLSDSVQKRNEMALERHRIRMENIRAKKLQNGGDAAGPTM